MALSRGAGEASFDATFEMETLTMNSADFKQKTLS